MKKKIGLIVFIMMLVMLFSFTASAATQAPGQVTGVKQTRAYDDCVFLDWNDIAGTEYYQIYVSDSLNGTYKLYDEFPWDSEGWIENLKPGNSYFVKVRSYWFDDDYNNVYGKFSSPMEVVTVPSNVKNVKQVQNKIKVSSSVVKWDAVHGAEYYIVQYGSKKIKTSKTSARIPFAKKKDSLYVSITPCRATGSFAAKGDDTGKEIFPRPRKAQKPKCSMFSSLDSTAAIQWKLDDEDGSQYKLYNNKGKCIKTVTSKDMYGYVTLYNMKFNQFYSFKARNYKKINGKKVYGAWSDKLYFCGPNKIKGKRTGKTIKINWTRIAGATNYTVYISKAYDGGYKKVATTKNNKITIKKFGKNKLKKNQCYYVKVVANKKVGKKIYKTTDPDFEGYI